MPYKCSYCNTNKYVNNNTYVHTEECSKIDKYAHLYINNKLKGICQICKNQFEQKSDILYWLCSDCDDNLWNRIRYKEEQLEIQKEEQQEKEKKEQQEKKEQEQKQELPNKDDFPQLISPFEEKLKENNDLKQKLKELEEKLKQSLKKDDN
jgi:hypothetical protein